MVSHPSRESQAQSSALLDLAGARQKTTRKGLLNEKILSQGTTCQQAGSPNRHRDVFSKTQGYVFVFLWIPSYPVTRARQAQSASLLDLLRSQTEDYNKGILNEDSVSRKLFCYTHCSFKMHACYTYMFGTQTEDYQKGTSE